MRSLLVIRLSSLGDVLFALPAVEALRRGGVAEHLAWLVEDKGAPLLAGWPGIDELLVFPRRRRAAWPSHVRALHQRRDDAVLDLQGNFKSRVQRACLRAPRRLGHAAPIAREGAAAGLTETIAVPFGAHHRVDQALACLTLFGLTPPLRAERPAYPVDEAARTRTAAFLQSLPGDGPRILLHPGTSAFGQLKRWPPARFAALGNALVADHGAQLLLSGTPDEEPLLAEVAAGLRAPAPRLPGAGLAELAAALTCLDLIVASDTLPLHLANLVGTPVVGLYGPKDPAINGPYYDRAEVVRAGVDCSPCSLRRCGDPICMTRLTLEPVRAAVARSLAP